MRVPLHRHRFREPCRSPLSPRHPACSRRRVVRRQAPVSSDGGYKLRPLDGSNPPHSPPPHSNRTQRKETPAGEALGTGSSPEITGRSLTDATTLRCSQGTPSSFPNLLTLWSSLLTPRHGPCAAQPHPDDQAPPPPTGDEAPVAVRPPFATLRVRV